MCQNRENFELWGKMSFKFLGVLTDTSSHDFTFLFSYFLHILGHFCGILPALGIWFFSHLWPHDWLGYFGFKLKLTLSRMHQWETKSQTKTLWHEKHGSNFWCLKLWFWFNLKWQSQSSQNFRGMLLSVFCITCLNCVL